MLNRRTALVSSVLVGTALSGLLGANLNARAEREIYGLTMRHVAAPPAVDQRISTALVKIAEAAEPKAPAKPVAKKAAKPQPGSKTLDEWIENLALAESGGRTTFQENGGLPYIIDVNGKRSYSCLQFQSGTFTAYSKQHGITGDITDCATQKKLAKAMIQEKRGNYRHWLNSSKKIGLPPL